MIETTPTTVYDYSEGADGLGSVLVSEVEDTGCAFFFRLRVRPAHRQRGIATALVKKLIDDFKHTELYCDAKAFDDPDLTDEQLVQWYQRLGFEIAGPTHKRFKALGTLMVKMGSETIGHGESAGIRAPLGDGPGKGKTFVFQDYRDQMIEGTAYRLHRYAKGSEIGRRMCRCFVDVAFSGVAPDTLPPDVDESFFRFEDWNVEHIGEKLELAELMKGVPLLLVRQDGMIRNYIKA